MERSAPLRLFGQYAIPQMLGLLCNSVYFIVDGVWIGHRLGSAAMAAAGVGVPLLELLIALSMALTAGSGVLISSRRATGAHEGAQRAFYTAILVQLALGICIQVLGLYFLQPLARLAGATEDIEQLTMAYLRYILLFAPFQMLSYLLGGLARNDGAPTHAMWALAVGSISNIWLDYVFLYPLHMGIAGAALATGIGPVLSLLLLLPHFLTGKGRLCLYRPAFSLRDARDMCHHGVPSLVMEYSIGLVTFFTNTALVRAGYGSMGLAAYLVIGYLMLIFLTLFLGMAEGLQPVMTYLHASGAAQKSRALFQLSAGIFLAVGLLGYAGIYTGSIHFYRLFTPDDPDLAAFAAAQSRWYFCAFFAAGLNILCISHLQATLQPGKALLLSTLRGIFLPMLLLGTLPLWQKQLLWGCHSLAELLTFAFAVLLYTLAAKSKP